MNIKDIVYPNLLVDERKNYYFINQCFIIWVSILVATPVAFSLRYVFALALSLSLMITIPVIINRRFDDEG